MGTEPIVRQYEYISTETETKMGLFSNSEMSVRQGLHDQKMQSLQHERDMIDKNSDLQTKNQKIADLTADVSSLKRRLAEANEKLEVGDTSGMIADLKMKLEFAEKKIEEREKTIIKQKDLLRERMVYQIAFKNLFKKYGKLPNGKSVNDMPDSEKLKLLEQETENADLEMALADENARRQERLNQQHGCRMVLMKSDMATIDDIKKMRAKAALLKR